MTMTFNVEVLLKGEDAVVDAVVEHVVNAADTHNSVPIFLSRLPIVRQMVAVRLLLNRLHLKEQTIV